MSLLYDKQSHGVILTAGINGILYGSNMSSSTSSVRAIRLSSGKTLWTKSYSDFLRDDCFSGTGVIYTGTQNGSIEAIKENNGNIVWNYPQNNGYSDATFAGKIVFANAVDGNLYALNSSNGSLLWESSDISGNSAPPAVGGSVVYDNSFSGQDVYAFSAKTGDVIWTSPALDGNPVQQPTVGSSALFEGTNEGYVYGLNRSTGDVLWSFYTGVDTYVFAYQSGVVLALLNSNPTTYYALNATTGNVLWSIGPVAAFPALPAIAGNEILVVNSNYVVQALSLNAGSLVWSYNLPGSPIGIASIFPVSQYIVVSTQSELYVFNGVYATS